MPYNDYKVVEKTKKPVVIKHKTTINTEACEFALKSEPE